MRRGVLIWLFATLVAASVASPASAVELGPLQNLSSSRDRSLHPRIARSGDAAYVAWLEEGGLRPGLTVARFGDRGGQREVSHVVGCRSACWHWDIAAAERAVYVTWVESDGSIGNWSHEVYVAASADRGETFSAPRRVSAPGGTSWFAQVSASGTGGWVGWQEQDGGVMLRRVSVDEGAIQLHDPVRIGDAGAAGGQARFGSVSIAADRGVVHIAWSNTADEVFTASSKDAPATLSAPRLLARRRVLGRPVIGVDGRDVHVAWHGDGQLELATSHDGGAEFAIRDVGGPSALRDGPALAADGGVPYVTWTGVDGGVYLSRGGVGARIAVGLAPEVPTVAVSGRSVHVGWTEVPYYVGQDAEATVHIASSRDAGASFDVIGGAAFSLGRAREQSIFQRVAAFDDGFAVAWMGHSGRNLENSSFEIGFRAGAAGDPDVAALDAKAVQAASEATRLAAGRPVAVRAVVRSGMRRSSVLLEAELRDGSASMTVRRTVALSAGTQTVWLPARDFRPSTSAVEVTLRIDPRNALAEPDETNNEVAAHQVVVDTEALGLLFVPVGVRGGDPAPGCADVERLRRGSLAYIHGTFPLDDRETRSIVACAGPVEADPSLGADRMIERLLRDLAARRWEVPEADKVVGVLPDGFFGAHFPPAPTAIGLSPLGVGVRHEISAVVLEAGAAAAAAPQLAGGQVLAHELAHNLGRDHVVAVKAPGYWVARDREFGDELDFMHPLAGDQWVGAGTADYILNQLAISGGGSGPARTAAESSEGSLAVSGVLRADGSLESAAWYLVDTPPDVRLGAAGTYTAEFVAADGTLLGTAGFDVEHAVEAYGDTGGELPPVRAFAFTLPYIEGTSVVRVRRDADLLLTRARSASTPTVRVTAPSSGEAVRVGRSTTLTWVATDADGDELRHLVSISRDGGTTWVPLATGLTEPRLTFTPSSADVSSTALIRVTTSDGLNTGRAVSDTFRIVPADGAIAFSRRCWLRCGEDAGGRVYAMNADGSELTQVTRGVPGADDVEPDWSPDGSRIAFARECAAGTAGCRPGIYVIGADGTQERLLFDGPGADRAPDWSPGGQRLVFADGMGALRTVAADGSDARELAAGISGANPAWSPDGTTIAYERAGTVRLIGADGAGDRLLDGLGGSPAWSPDGARIAMSRCTGRGTGGTCLVDAAGGGRQVISSRPGAGGPSFSGDGQQLTFERTWGPPTQVTPYFAGAGRIVARGATSAVSVFSGQVSSAGCACYVSAEFAPDPVTGVPAWGSRQALAQGLQSREALDVAKGPAGEVVSAWSHLPGCDWAVTVRTRAAGGALGAPTTVSEPCVWSRFPAVGVDAAGDTHVAWYQQQTGQPYAVKARSTTNGVWGDVVLLSDPQAMASNPVQLAAAGSRAIAVFAESVGASSERLVARIRERGTWGPATVLSTHPQSSVASDYRVGMDRDANALVTWRQGGRVRFAVHEDGSWRAPEIVPQTHQGIAQADMRMGSDGTAILAYAVQSPTGTQDGYVSVRRAGAWGEPARFGEDVRLSLAMAAGEDGSGVITYYRAMAPGNDYVAARAIRGDRLAGPETSLGASPGTRAETVWDLDLAPDGTGFALWQANDGESLRSLAYGPPRVATLASDGAGEKLLAPAADAADSDPDWQRAPSTPAARPPGPVVEAGGPYAATEGAAVALAGEATGSGELTVTWDLDGDGDHDDATGLAPHVTFPDDGRYLITARVTDATGAVSTDGAEVEVSNAAPTLHDLAASVTDDGVATVSGRIGDAGVEERHEVLVDWGDESPPEPATISEEGDLDGFSGVYRVSDAKDRTVVLTARDEDGGETIRTIPVVRLPADLPPTASSASVAAEAGVPIQVMLSGSDPEGGPVSFEVVDAPAGGAAAFLDADTSGELTYVPRSDFAGTDRVRYRTSDGRRASTPATLTVEVRPRSVSSAPDAPAPDPVGPALAQPMAPVTELFQVPADADVRAAVDAARARLDRVAASVIGLPTARRCVSRRRINLHLRTPKGRALISATVRVSGRPPLTLRGPRLRPSRGRLGTLVSLVGLPKGRFTVTVSVTTSGGERLKTVRRYRTCSPKRRSKP